MNTEIIKKLEEIAFKKTIPFCYGCYKETPAGRCNSCCSDDLMRLLPGSGCEYGVDWVIEELLRTHLNPVNVDEAFEESIRDCYPEETEVGWMNFDTITLMKAMDPISWKCGLSEWESAEAEEGNILSLDGGSTYYSLLDLENFIEEQGFG